MKRILLLKQMNESDVSTIELLLQSSGIECQVSLATKAVILHGDNDVLANARRILVEYGYELL